MIREVLVVDDEALARNAVARQVAVLLPEARLREARDGFDALDRIREQAPDLVFLDVEMPELSGLDLLRQLPPPRPRIVFVTAYEHFAVRAFEEHATDYLVKPFTPERFARAVARVADQMDSEARLAALEQSIGNRIEKLALRRGTGFDVVAPPDVVCLLSIEHYTHLYANGHEYVSELPLIHFEQRFDPAVFARVHRNALINVRRIARVGGDDVVRMDNGMNVPLSRRSRGPLLERLKRS